MDALTDNLWLATLRPVDRKRLAPHLKETPFDPGLMLYDIGEAVRWRILNMSGIAHPMHLHGFYFTVDGRGDTQRDTASG